MANSKISQLPLGNLTPSTLFPIVTSGVTSQTSFANIQAAIGSGGSQDLQSVLDAGGFAEKDEGDSYVQFLTTRHGSTLFEAFISANSNDQHTEFYLTKDNINFYNHAEGIGEGGLNVDSGKVELFEKSGTGESTSLRFNIPTHYTDLRLPAKPSDGTYTLATLDDITSVGIITKTKGEIDTLISTNGLVAGATYKITGVHPTLYNDGTNLGTTIYLQALTENKLTTSGFGGFWNPKYNKSIEGFGVWTNVNTWTPTLVSGYFNANEDIVGNGGQTGKLFGGLQSGFFIATSTGWGTATSITGTTSNATANISGIALKTYNINDKVIWGGYSWTNVTGSVGDNVNILTMDANWTKDVYSTVNYNKVIDIIEYDYSNDWISRRYEVSGSNDVIQTFDDSDYIGFDNPSISVFMFGNPYSGNKGVGGVKVINSYFETVDSYDCSLRNIMIKDGSYISDNHLYRGFLENINLNSGSYIQSNKFIIGGLYTNTLLNYSYIESNTLNNSSITYCNLSASYIEDNYIRSGVMSSNTLQSFSGIGRNKLNNGGAISDNNLNYSNIYDNTSYNSGYITENELSNSSGISNNVFSGSGYSYITENSINTKSTIGSNIIMPSSNIKDNTVSNSSYIIYNTMNTSAEIINCDLKNNSIFNIGTGNTLSASTTLLTMENATISGNISSISSLLSANHPKTAYKRPDGVTKLRYYNNSDTLIIVGLV